jgi:hypothetical protein
MAAYYVITYQGIRRAGPFATDAEAMTALAELHRIEGTGCMDLDVEVAADAETEG